MCGIAGILGQRNEKLCVELLKKIQHRGPDNSDFWLSPSSEYPVSLCHTRLSILDLSNAGSQPFHSSDGRYAIVYNGEIYNFIELRGYLSKRYDIIFKSNTDTEVLLCGIIFEGINFLHRCNGMWAFCFWDKLKSEGILCRDRFGIKPLYYTYMSRNSLGFSSEMKGLSPLLKSINPSPHIDSIFKYDFGYEFSDICSIDGIHRLPSGSYAIFKDGSITIEKWWTTLDHLGSDGDGLDYSSQVEQWRDLFFDSVNIRMRSDVRIGTALSGGLDSSSVLAAMAAIDKTPKSGLDPSRISSDWQYAINCSFPNSSIDESEFARLVANSCDVSFEILDINSSISSSEILNDIAQVEDPYLTIPSPMLATYRAMKERGISVTLDGHGADEMLSGYDHLRYTFGCSPSLSEFKEILAIDESVRSGIFSPREQNSIKARLRLRLKHLLVTKGLYPALMLKTSLGRIQKRLYADELENRLMDAQNEIYSHDSFASLDAFTQVLYELFHLTVLPTLLRNYDRYSMAAGLEVRMPFMDWRLVCLTFSLPWRAKLGGSYTKRILRDSMAGCLIDSVRLRRDKIGWNAPAHQWLHGHMRPLIQNYLSNPEESKYYSSFKRACSFFYEIPEPTFVDGVKTWKAILPFLWSKSLSSSAWS